MRTAKALGVLGLVPAVWLLFAAAPPVPGLVRLTVQQQKHVDALEGRAIAAIPRGEFEEVAKLLGQVAEYRVKHQGARHHESIDAALAVEEWQRRAKVPVKDRVAVLRAMVLLREAGEMANQRKYREAEQKARAALAVREKVLGETHPDTATTYNNVARYLDAQGKKEEALALFRKAMTTYEKVLGQEHFSTAWSYDSLAHFLESLGEVEEALRLHRKALAVREKVLGEAHPNTARSYNAIAYCLISRGKPHESLPLQEKALAIWQMTLGEQHSATVNGYSNLAACLYTLGRATEALPLSKKVLAIREKTLGKEDINTAMSYDAVACNLHAMGHSQEALPLFQQALAIFEKTFGVDHAETAHTYNNLGACLRSVGKATLALPLLRKALATRERVFGEQHNTTASSYDSVASCLDSMGEAQQALPLYEKALAIRRKVRGEQHPDTAASYNNMASCLESLGQATKALPLHRKALAIRENRLGETHPDTAHSCNNVAACLLSLGKTSDALTLFKRSLAICEKSLGNDHPDAALCYNNIGTCLELLGEVREALPLHQKALAIRRKTLGESHPLTGSSYNKLASCHWALGDMNRAGRLWQQSLPAQEVIRLHAGATGFDRAVTLSDQFSPRAGLAATLVNLNQPCNAFAQAEASLARGLLDDLTGTITTGDSRRAGSLLARQKQLDANLVAFASLSQPTDEQRHAYEAARREHRAVSEELAQLVAAVSARQVRSLDRIQRAIPTDGALVLWLDLGGHWLGCVLRPDGMPLWTVQLGTDARGRMRKEDEALPDRLHTALTDWRIPDAERQKLTTAFLKLFMDPMRPHLKGVKRLLVVPTGPLAKVPLEALGTEYAVSYVPSGSVLAILKEKQRPLDGTSLLALGDPAFDRAPPPEPPDHGLLIVSVLPGSMAAKCDLRAGDVLLTYDGVRLGSADDLKPATRTRQVKATRWREGVEESILIQGGPLGVVLDARRSRAAVNAWRKERAATASPGTRHKRLPGTRYEVESLQRLVGKEKTTLLIDSNASEQKIDELQAKGELKKYRLIHLATHGEANDLTPRLGALILAQDKLPDALEQARLGKKPYNGRLTVGAIRAEVKDGGWELDCDLVVLSACETGLGRNSNGNGLLGFSQALIHKGARAVVLSRWKVDDTATALLMMRFYQNLLGKRPGLKQQMGRAAALAEASTWLRELPRAEAEYLAAHLAGGTLRDTHRSPGAPLPPRRGKPTDLPKGDKPFTHPYYWAGFTLLGDPD